MKLKLTVLFLSLVVATVTPAKYLSEKPAFVTPCVHGQSSFGTCFASNFQVVFDQWKDGLPGLKSVGKLDPLDVKRIRISQQSPNALIVLHAELTNVVVTGASTGIVKAASLNKDKLLARVKFVLPTLRFDADYRAKGRVLSLPINGSGKCFFETENVVGELQITMALRREHGHIFTDVTHLGVSMKEIGGFRIRLENLFGGQRDLEESANTLFNENWRDLYEVLRPAVEQTVAAVIEDRMKKIFSYVPASYFVANLE